MRIIEKNSFSGKLLLVIAFAVAFAYVEAAIVVYLRQLIYADGFHFPLRTFPKNLIVIEIFRELATMVMLAAVALILDRSRWTRFGYFMIAFGVWDIFYYIWLKATIGWPSSLTDWDILFLVPLPWIGPVIAPVAISMVMIFAGLMIVYLIHRGVDFRPGPIAWIAALVASALILFSFMRDTGAGLHQQMPKPYSYHLLLTGLILYLIGIYSAWLSSRRHRSITP